MEIKVDEKGKTKVAIITSDSIIIQNVNDALDLIANVGYYGCEKMLLRKEHLTEEFFNLKTGLAGEILQKYTNYKMKVALVGEFDSYNSKSLKDYMYECNKGKQAFFKQTEEEALESLHGINT
ncbi:DUF4180 domain-containing protein [Brevibacillus laterosporus]|uniref:DUF4180 domain-containing protein n=1 Tax=Brevibacillus laterosporus TaxID=1465 RepID=UPI002653CAAA|nr:DUF4180 domain-containing protein [Brevibacillus laterosporus]MDN9009841.1 DUF4180 domain-containing protein [Brevibacillus laterosporus]MDO0940777.1 DUF4180 domain-containing protein [Brevibacillus laterosporus]